MIKTVFYAAALSAVAFAPSVSANDSDNEPASLCVPEENWTRDTALVRYFRDHYYEFDVHSSAFISSTGGSERILSEPLEERVRVGTALHDRILGIIYRLGRLLPRFSRPVDVMPMAEQVQAGTVRDPDTGEYVEFLRVALVHDLLASSDDAAVVMARFLTDLDALESQTHKMSGGDITPDMLQALYEMQKQASISRRAFRDILKQVIFADDLQDRMAARLDEYCNRPVSKE